MHMRAGHEEDYDAVIALWVGADLGQPTDDEWRAITIGRVARLLVAEEDGVVAGASVVSFDGWRGYIYHIAVSPEYQHRGIAKALMADAERRVRREGGTRIFAIVNGENTAGLALAAAAGYVSDGDVGFVKELVPLLA
jgi:ribosomal protein S18 acetylase RimI-like enzyme